MGFTLIILRILIWLFFILIFLLPLIPLFLSFSSSSLIEIVREKSFLNAFLNSLFISTFSTIISLILGSLTGFLISKVDLPGRKIFTILLMIPLLVVPYQFALSWSLILPPSLTKLLFTKWGVVFILAESYYPVILLLTIAGLNSISREEEESALILSKPSKIFTGIYLRRVLPFLIAGSLIVFLFSFSEVGVATYLGVDVIPYEILVKFSAFYDLKGATIYAVPMGVMGLLLFIFEYFLFSKSISFTWRGGAGGEVVYKSRILKYTGFFLTTTLIIILVIMPLSGMIMGSVRSENIFRTIVTGTESLLRSLFFSLIAAFSGMIWGFLAIYLCKRFSKSIFGAVTLLTFFISPPVIATGILYSWGKFLPFLYGTALTLIAGWLARFSFPGIKILESAFENLDRASEEAAIIAGAGEIRRGVKIIFPQVRNWFYAGVILIFVFSMNELSASTMLYPPGGETLVVRLYTLTVNNSPEVLSVLSLLNLTGTLLFSTLFMLYGVKRRNK